MGRRLAFDQNRGRLWVVCGKCERWNLTPLEERWEAIESCERLFRDTRKRVSTDNIGLARLSEGLELVRIGEPQRPEFAAWRYGDQFGRRRTRGMLAAAGVATAGVGILALSTAGVVVGGALLIAAAQGLQFAGQLTVYGGRLYNNRKVLGELRSSDGTRWVVRGRYLQTLRLIPSSLDEGWGIEVGCEAAGVRRRATIEGQEARLLAAKLVPRFNPDGGAKDEVQRAVKRIEAQVTPENYLRWLSRNTRGARDWMRRKDPITGERLQPGTTYDSFGMQGQEVALAVEMAVNEENERRALDGELGLLELAWKEAEEIAAIADRLALPPNVESRLNELKSRRP